MKAVANSILVALLVSIFLLTFTNFLMFFPWYLTLVFETFNLSTRAASVNYIEPSMAQEVFDDLKNRPLYRSYTDNNKLIITYNSQIVRPNSDSSVIKTRDRKQRGVTFNAGIQATFPFVIKVFGKTYTKTQSVKFEIPTTGIRYYKDIN